MKKSSTYLSADIIRNLQVLKVTVQHAVQYRHARLKSVELLLMDNNHKDHNTKSGISKCEQIPNAPHTKKLPGLAGQLLF
jgi:hypothetical protein